MNDIFPDNIMHRHMGLTTGEKSQNKNETTGHKNKPDAKTINTPLKVAGSFKKNQSLDIVTSLPIKTHKSQVTPNKKSRAFARVWSLIYTSNIWRTVKNGPGEKNTKVKTITPISTNKPDKHFINNKKLLYVSVLLIAFISLFLIRNVQLIKNRAPKTRFLNISPEKLYKPSGLPDGYRLSSGEQRLENGALLYSVNTKGGNTITITQQAKPEELPENFFSESIGFNTKYGKAFITQDGALINGYLLTEKTWVLFYSVGTSTDEMRLVINSVKPT